MNSKEVDENVKQILERIERDKNIFSQNLKEKRRKREKVEIIMLGSSTMKGDG